MPELWSATVDRRTPKDLSSLFRRPVCVQRRSRPVCSRQSVQWIGRPLQRCGPGALFLRSCSRCPLGKGGWI